MYYLDSKNTTNLCKQDDNADRNMGYDINPTFSPDGKYIAWQSMERDGYESDRNRLCVRNIENGKKTTYVKSFTVAGNFYDLLKNITALANNSHLPTAMGMTAFGAPSVLVDGLTVAGK